MTSHRKLGLRGKPGIGPGLMLGRQLDETVEKNRYKFSSIPDTSKLQIGDKIITINGVQKIQRGDQILDF